AIVGFGVAFVYINWSDFKSILDISFTNSSTSASEEITNNQKAPEASPRTQSNQTITKAEENKEEKTDAKQQQVQTVARRIQVEVLNGCGVDGLAEKITDFLRRNNIDVVSRGNYVHFEVPETKIIDRMGNRDRSQIVADILGVPEDQVETQQNKNLQLDATIILGADYKILKPFIKQGRL
ncbi:LytR C-terminal domain-containing protein, partial [Candidatus Saccharibacteria bacterium]|nr:LytR C-terminal domain-containing protein [Candidatus Saccharibacteria bacterium]NIW78874.1 hypothetical protein [Calditrichia bacterium]